MVERLIMGVPEHIVPRDNINHDDLRRFEKVTGILKTRRFSGTTIEMIQETVWRSGLLGEQELLSQVDALIVVTQSPDRLSPCMAVQLHHFFGLRENVPAFDVNHACDGYIMALHIAKNYEKALVICADRLRYGPTPVEALIFSDSVSISIVTPGDWEFIKFYNDGSHYKKLYCGLDGEMQMDGNAVFDFVTTKVPIFAKPFTMLFQADFMVPHQANISMNKILESRMGFKDRTVYSLSEYGNMSMNSIPMAISHNQATLLGKKLLLLGFGAGYSAAAMFLKWSDKRVCKVVEI